MTEPVSGPLPHHPQWIVPPRWMEGWMERRMGREARDAAFREAFRRAQSPAAPEEMPAEFELRDGDRGKYLESYRRWASRRGDDQVSDWEGYG